MLLGTLSHLAGALVVMPGVSAGRITVCVCACLPACLFVSARLSASSYLCYCARDCFYVLVPVLREWAGRMCDNIICPPDPCSTLILPPTGLVCLLAGGGKVVDIGVSRLVAEMSVGGEDDGPAAVGVCCLCVSRAPVSLLESLRFCVLRTSVYRYPVSDSAPGSASSQRCACLCAFFCT